MAFKQEAVEVARRLMKEFPHRSDPVGLMGTVQNSLGRTDEALRYWQQCLKLDPQRADVYKMIGWIALRKGESKKALERCRKAMAVDPDLPELHELAARALMNLGRPREAIDHLRKQIEISPRSNSIYYLLGEAHLRLKEYDRAKEAYLTAIDVQPGFKSSYYGLATACMKLGQTEEATKYRQLFKKLKDSELKELIEETTGYNDVASVRNGLVGTLIKAGQIYLAYGDLVESEKHWQRAAALDPNNAPCRVKLTELYQQTGRNQAALQICRQLAEIEPEKVMHRMNVGILNARLKQYGDAERALREVIELAPRDPNGYRELARVLLRAKRNFPEAKTLASTAVRLEPAAAHYFVLGEACDRSGDLAGALAALERAIELDPGNARYRRVRDFITNRK